MIDIFQKQTQRNQIQGNKLLKFSLLVKKMSQILFGKQKKKQRKVLRTFRNYCILLEFKQCTY